MGEQMDSYVKQLLEKFKEELTLDGRKRVFEDGYKLSTDFMKQKADPEAFTKEFLIEPIIRKFNLSKLPEKHFRGIRQDLRKVDYILKNQKGKSFLAEAKPLNSDLFEKSVHGAVNQIKGLFRLAEVQRDYEFGIATDGLKWVFIGKNSKVVFQYDIRQDLDKIEEILIGKEEVSSEKIEEEISKKFYVWYNALLHGGKYKDHENKTRTISAKDCLVENILFVSKPEDREQIAQTIMDRLIFIKFLQSKGIVSYDILEYLLKLDENILNEKLKQLFFSVLNTKKSKRVDVDPKFKDIPYLNGSLFVRTEAELRNPDYKIRSFILKEVIKFLDSFKFIHTEDVSNQKILDPEILGYIFERAMTATDRKGTGAYYTPKTITNYISKNTIHPVIVKRVNKLLKEKGYKDSELLKDIEEVYRLRESTLGEVFSDIILNLKICDNACGSGAFLLAAADVLLEVYKRINEELRLKNSEIAMRKLILQNNLYGVDINPNAVEIAKLRLWLWLVTAYEPDKVEPLPNIDYNIRVGNSLIGYVDISKFRDHKLTLLDWYSAEKSLNILLKKREDKIKEYKTAVGDKARELKSEIDDLDKKIKKLLDINLFQEISKKVKIDEEEFRKTNPFHWGFEFYEVFNGNGENEDKGFDAVIGNPPYGDILKPFERLWFRKTFDISKTDKNGKGTTNAAALFIRRTHDLVNGYFGYIVPNSISRTDEFEKLRNFLLDNTKLFHIVDEGSPFVGVTLEMISLFYEKINQKGIDYKIKILSRREKVDKKNNFVYKTIFQKYNRFMLYWDDFFEKIVSISQLGFLDGKRGITIPPRYLSKNKTQEFNIPVLISGKSVRRYMMDKSQFKWGTKKILSFSNEAKEIYEKEMLISTRLSRFYRVAVKPKRYIAADNVIRLIFNEEIIDKRVMMAILNSKFMRYISLKYLNNYINLTMFINAITKVTPIKIPKNQKEIITIVDKIIELKKKNVDVSNYEKKLDKLVYKLYDITPEEQKIIEESLK
jgi:hypothetical protein